MYHSITFGIKNTWDDWHLIPSSRPIFAPAPLKTNYVDLPNTDGHIDLLTRLVGAPTYANRTGSFEFIVANEYWSWEVAYSTILNYLHGRAMHAVLEDDPLYYYDGRFGVNSWQSDKNYSLIVINYNVIPAKQLVGGV